MLPAWDSQKGSFLFARFQWRNIFYMTYFATTPPHSSAMSIPLLLYCFGWCALLPSSCILFIQDGVLATVTYDVRWMFVDTHICHIYVCLSIFSTGCNWNPKTSNKSKHNFFFSFFTLANFQWGIQWLYSFYIVLFCNDIILWERRGWGEGLGSTFVPNIHKEQRKTFLFYFIYNEAL